MKLIGKANDRYQFHLARREKDLFTNVIRLYPRIPSSHQRLTKTATLEGSNQRLLDEALAETRSQNQRGVEALLADPQRLAQHEDGWRLTLSTDEVEWLLQVLNDIRVGSWLQLGSPEALLKVLTPETVPHLWAMEMAGSLQMRFLELLDQDS